MEKIFIKIGLDVAYIVVVVIVYFVNVFSFMDGFKIGVTHLSKKYENEWFSIYTSEPFSYYKENFCNGNSETKEICDCLSAWEIAGIFYLIFTALSFIFVAYGMLCLIGRYFRRDFTFYLKSGNENYIYPVIYIIALVFYVTLSKVFFLEPPKGFSSDWGVKVEPGIILMFLALVISIMSLICYVFLKKEQNSQQGLIYRPLLEF